MNNWAAAGKYDCNFLCICVLGDRRAVGLAREFSKEMKLTHCVNAFVDNEADMPTYGQLGCKGFIILDGNHRVVSPGTSSFMEVKGLAFQHVEALLDAVCSNNPLPAVCPGENVELVEPPPGQPQLRGAQGICVKLEDGSMDFGFMSGPLRGRMMKVPASTVRKLDMEDVDSGDESPSACGPGGCSMGPAKGDCSQGGCDQGGCNKSESSQGACDKAGCNQGETLTALDGAFVAASLQIASVKVPSMDAEHSECAAALQRLAQEGSHGALEGVLSCLTGHFAHEEALFEEFGFGAHKNESLSAKKTHMEDHKRILNKIQRQLVAASSCVPAEFVREVLQDFHEHTSRYDSQYAEPLSEQGAR
mmetsp:Transcript_108306/g.288201  ORF Transcript_108306/g.288201 Transcript_108306/m.288201 type:complete len:362 (-) Transcript_108306:411-1496(-)